ncbi:PilN domain-containing protein [Undibacterium flavidum]|uniref:PilN domain-containing protein n=1 Tax=Undibacterium flavidum TaxID=2762297 RepID=A0ABR6YFF6_9BURK|nr:PilN domain-containing protein [Undibacterium flavidum]MBC3875272.1 PilN domain-containing protein [Undibacterium flavidum]
MSQQINLFNPALIKQKSFFSALNLLIGLALSVVIVIAVFAYVRTQMAQIKKTTDQSASQLTAMNERVNSLRNGQVPKVKSPILEQELTMIEASLMRRHRIAQILQNSEFGNTEGYSAYLIAFARQIPANVWLTGFSLEGAGFDLVLQGRTLQAESVPLYVTQLKREKIMQGKTFSMIEMDRPLLALLDSISGADNKKKTESAPYLEFQLHSSELKQKNEQAGVKAP